MQEFRRANPTNRGAEATAPNRRTRTNTGDHGGQKPTERAQDLAQRDWIVSKVVEAYNYRIGVDARGVTAGTSLTRRELGNVRRTFRELTGDADKVSHRMDLMTRAFKTGEIDQRNYRSAVAELAAKLPEAAEAQKRRNDAESNAAKIRESLITNEQRYQRVVRETMQTVRDGGLARSEAAEHLRRQKREIFGLTEAEQAEAKAQRTAAEVTRELMTDTDRLREKTEELANAVRHGTLRQEQADVQLDRYRRGLKSTMQEERERQSIQARLAEITRRNETETERYSRELRELNQLKKVATGNTAALTREETRLREALQRASRGTGSQRVRVSDALDQVSMMPGAVGGLAGSGAALATLNPAAAAAGVAMGGFAIGTAAATRAAIGFSREMRDQSLLITELSQRARIAGADLERFTGFQYALRREAGISMDQSGELLTELTVRLAEAAAGSGEAKESIERLGLDVQKLARLDPTIAFRQIVQAANKLPNPLDRSLVAVNLMGDEGVKVAAIFDRGVDALDDAADAAERLGLNVSEVDATAVQQLTTRVQGLRDAYSGLARQTLVELAPALTVTARDAEGLVGMINRGPEVAPWLDLTTVLRGTAMAFSRFTGLAAETPVNVLTTYLDVQMERGEKLREGIERETEARQENLEIKRRSAALEAAQAAQQEQVQNLLSGLRDQARRDEEATLESQMRQMRQLNAESHQMQELVSLHSQLAQEKRDAQREESEREALRQRQQEAARLRQTMEATREELRLSKETLRVKESLSRFHVSDTTAEQVAQLSIAGATRDELAKHLSIRRQIDELNRNQERREEAKQRAKDRTEELTQQAESIRDSLMSPVEVLASRFRELDELASRGLLNTAEVARQRAKEAADVLTEEADAPRSAAAFSTDMYSVLVEQQQRRRKERENESIIAAADRRNAKERERLAINEKITGQMRNQSRLIPNRNGVGTGVIPVNTHAGGQAMQSNEQLIALFERIAQATERTNDRLDQMEPAQSI